MNQAVATSKCSCMWMLECNSQILKPGGSVCTLACCRNQKRRKEWPWEEGDTEVLMWTQKPKSTANSSQSQDMT